jgi:hypothetical protein
MGNEVKILKILKMKNYIQTKTTVKIITIFVLFLSFVGCYNDFAEDFDYSSVYFGAQKPVRTLVTRIGRDELEFKIGVGLGGVRDNTKGYSVEYKLEPELLTTVSGADKLLLLPKDCYSGIDTDHTNTFFIPPGSVIGDCLIRINKVKFVNLPGSLINTYALPFKLLKTSADTILLGKDYTVIVIKYIDEHSGSYFCRGRQDQWDGTAVIPETTIEYSHVDWSRNKIRVLTTVSLTEFDMAGMGELSGSAAADHLLISLVDEKVTLSTRAGNTNVVTDNGSSYNPNTQIFTLDYIYTKGAMSYRVTEELKLRQDVEKELRFEVWAETEEEE